MKSWQGFCSSSVQDKNGTVNFQQKISWQKRNIKHDNFIMVNVITKSTNFSIFICIDYLLFQLWFLCSNSITFLFNSIFRFTPISILLWTHTISCLSKARLFNNSAKALFLSIIHFSATSKPAFSTSISRSVYYISFLFILSFSFCWDSTNFFLIFSFSTSSNLLISTKYDSYFV